MFGIGGFELFIILIFGFLIFGPDKLPDIAKTVGKGIARFRQAQQDMNESLGGEKIFDPSNPDEPFKNPVEVLDRMAQRQEEKKRAQGATSGDAAEKAPAQGKAAAVKKPASQAEEAPAQAAKAAESAEPESFTERKARYERERAARKAAEEAAGAPKGTAPEAAGSSTASGTEGGE